jgi:hypothetical protein
MAGVCVTRHSSRLAFCHSDELANVAAEHVARFDSGLSDPDNLLSKIFALQKSEKCFGHLFNPVEYVLFEANFPRLLPSGQTLQCFVSPMPPVKN